MSNSNSPPSSPTPPLIPLIRRPPLTLKGWHSWNNYSDQLPTINNGNGTHGGDLNLKSNNCVLKLLYNWMNWLNNIDLKLLKRNKGGRRINSSLRQN